MAQKTLRMQESFFEQQSRSTMVKESQSSEQSQLLTEVSSVDSSDTDEAQIASNAGQNVFNELQASKLGSKHDKCRTAMQSASNKFRRGVTSIRHGKSIGDLSKVNKLNERSTLDKQKTLKSAHRHSKSVGYM